MRLESLWLDFDTASNFTSREFVEFLRGIRDIPDIDFNNYWGDSLQPWANFKVYGIRTTTLTMGVQLKESSIPVIFSLSKPVMRGASMTTWLKVSVGPSYVTYESTGFFHPDVTETLSVTNSDTGRFVSGSNKTTLNKLAEELDGRVVIGRISNRIDNKEKGFYVPSLVPGAPRGKIILPRNAEVSIRDAFTGDIHEANDAAYLTHAYTGKIPLVVPVEGRFEVVVDGPVFVGGGDYRNELIDLWNSEGIPYVIEDGVYSI